MANMLIEINDSFTTAELKGLLFPNGDQAVTANNEPQNFVNNFKNYLSAMNGKQYAAGCLITADVGAGYATATLTVSSTGSTNNQTMSLLGQTFTAKTSGAGANEFDISTTPATQAANMVAAFNASAAVNIYVVATNVLGVITLTALVPGVEGNSFAVSESLTNVALSSFATNATGSNGTQYSFDLR
jgi:hypothetical protein